MMTEWARVMDKLYLTGISQIFTSIALAAAKKFNVSTNTAHLDSSSFHVHGEYETTMPQVLLVTRENNTEHSNGSAMNETVAPMPISITYGYSRDHRPDLKQFILDLICSGDGDVPFFLRVADGDEADFEYGDKKMGEAQTTQITVMPQQITQKSLPHFFKLSLRAVFAQILCDFKKQLNLDTLMVADSALYTAPNLAVMRKLKMVVSSTS